MEAAIHVGAILLFKTVLQWMLDSLRKFDEACDWNSMASLSGRAVFR